MGQRRRADRPLSEAFPAELVHGQHLFRCCEADILSQQTWQPAQGPHVKKSGGPKRCGQKYSKEFKHQWVEWCWRAGGERLAQGSGMWRFNSAPEGSAAPLTCAASGQGFGGMATCGAVCAAPCSAHRALLFSSALRCTRGELPEPPWQPAECQLFACPGQCTKSHLWPRSSCCQLCTGVRFACFSHVCQCGVWVVLFHWFWCLWECTQQD